MKKFTSLLLSALLCLSLLPGQDYAADEPDPPAQPVIVEPLDPKDPGEPKPPEEPVVPTCDVPLTEDTHI